MAGENIRKIKIVVLGDPGKHTASPQINYSVRYFLGVGKSSFVHQVCHREVLSSASSTVGCSIEVKVCYKYIDR